MQARKEEFFLTESPSERKYASGYLLYWFRTLNKVCGLWEISRKTLLSLQYRIFNSILFYLICHIEEEGWN